MCRNEGYNGSSRVCDGDKTSVVLPDTCDMDRTRYGCGQVEEKMTGGPQLQLDQSKTDEYDHRDAQSHSRGQKIQASSLRKLQQGSTDAKKCIEKNG